MTGPDSDRTLLDDLRAAHARREADQQAEVYGMCTACGSVEVKLDKATGTRDLSDIGEHPRYPTGYGCEVCA